MSTRNMLFKKEFPINGYISVQIPTVREVLENEDDYYNLVSLITAMPIDLMVQLDDIGIDFTQIDEYELFILLFPALQKSDTRMVFGGLDLSKFHTALNTETEKVVLRNDEDGITIDREIHANIADALRKIHHLEKDRRKPANGEAKEYMLERARKKLKRRKNKVNDSQIEELIVALVNTEQCKYGFEGIQELSIYQFNECVHQIIKKIDYDNRMHGVYSGTVNAKELSQKDLNWLTHK